MILVTSKDKKENASPILLKYIYIDEHSFVGEITSKKLIKALQLTNVIYFIGSNNTLIIYTNSKEEKESI